MGEPWGGLRLGDVVVQVARTRRMLVIDLDLDDPRQVTVAWNVGADTVERAYRIGALILVRRSSRA